MTAKGAKRWIRTTLADRTAIITGGASGIGLSLAEVFVASGARVLIVGRDPAKGAAACAQLATGPGSIRFAPVDVCDAGAVRATVDEAVREWGKLDFLFNNAGNTLVGEVRDMTLEHWNDILGVNLNGTINGVVAAYPIMVRQGHGHIVNTSSLSGIWPTPGAVPYVAAKHAVVGLSQALRLEAAPLGVRVSVVCPPLVATPLLETARMLAPGYQKMRDELPGTPMPSEKCAQIIVRAVLRNKGLILPGVSAVLARMYRFTPWANDLISRKIVSQMATMRDVT